MPSCIRCHGRTTTVLTYHHSDAKAFLDDARGHEKVYDGILLCDVHASRFSAPRGWTTMDRRARTALPLPEASVRDGHGL
ncbi:MAG: DUF3499 family protein [Actinomycetota bacterium]|nr:DUF3499 family protein [Actinomycetota bacterium]